MGMTEPIVNMVDSARLDFGSLNAPFLHRSSLPHLTLRRSSLLVPPMDVHRRRQVETDTARHNVKETHTAYSLCG